MSSDVIWVSIGCCEHEQPQTREGNLSRLSIKVTFFLNKFLVFIDFHIYSSIFSLHLVEPNHLINSLSSLLCDFIFHLYYLCEIFLKFIIYFKINLTWDTFNSRTLTHNSSYIFSSLFFFSLVLLIWTRVIIRVFCLIWM